MAWVTPVTDRTSGAARMTYLDMNRITGNLVWLYEECVRQGIAITGTPFPKTEWAQNDIIFGNVSSIRWNWYVVLSRLSNIYRAVGYAPSTVPNFDMTYENINNIETIQLRCYIILSSREVQSRLNHYIGDKLTASYLYAGDDFNSGGLYE